MLLLLLLTFIAAVVTTICSPMAVTVGCLCSLFRYLVELQAGCGDVIADLSAPLVILTATRFVLTALSVSLPIPSGTMGCRI